MKIIDIEPKDGDHQHQIIQYLIKGWSSSTSNQRMNPTNIRLKDWNYQRQIEGWGLFILWLGSFSFVGLINAFHLKFHLFQRTILWFLIMWNLYHAKGQPYNNCWVNFWLVSKEECHLEYLLISNLRCSCLIICVTIRTDWQFLNVVWCSTIHKIEG